MYTGGQAMTGERDEQPVDLGAISRFVHAGEHDQAGHALAYAAALVADRASADRVHAMCYEFAAAGIPYNRWPEMVVATLTQGMVGDDPELERARREALAMSLMDRGENASVRDRHGDDDKWS